VKNETRVNLLKSRANGRSFLDLAEVRGLSQAVVKTLVSDARGSGVIGEAWAVVKNS
jgi:hypothetical protein